MNLKFEILTEEEKEEILGYFMETKDMNKTIDKYESLLRKDSITYFLLDTDNKILVSILNYLNT